MKKISLQDKTRGAWAIATSKNPDLQKEYGSDGWVVWESQTGKMTQEQLARLYNVALPTSQRWHREYRERVAQ